MTTELLECQPCWLVMSLTCRMPHATSAVDLAPTVEAEGLSRTLGESDTLADAVASPASDGLPTWS